MDNTTRQFCAELLRENAALAEQAGCALAVASLLQQLMTNHGDHLGYPVITPDLSTPVLQDITRRLTARLQPLTAPVNGHDGLRVPVGAATADKE